MNTSKFKMPECFYQYHPYLTFCNNPNKCFIRPNGKPHEKLNCDTEALFNLGESAFHLLDTSSTTAEDFDQALKGNFGTIEELRKNLIERNAKQHFVFKNLRGQVFQPNLQDAEIGWILNLAWEFIGKHGEMDDPSVIEGLFVQLFVFHTFYEIDNALIAHDFGQGIAASVAAANALANAMAIASGDTNLQNARQEMSYRGAMAKLANDPRQTEKSIVFEWWQDWQKNPKKYKGKAAFARDMLANSVHLQNTKTIEDWCREWEKSHPDD
ncbi:MAG: hypothetical protein WAO71_15320 [Gallionella sp.]